MITESIINVKNPFLESNLTACVMDGVTDDLQNLQAIHDYMVNHYETSTLYIPDGKLLIKDTFNWRIDKVKINCNGEIIADINDITKYAIQTRNEVIQTQPSHGNEGVQNSPTNSIPLYFQNRINVQGLVLKAKNICSCNGIIFSSINNETSSSRINFENCCIANFNIALTFGESAYLNKFNNCDIFCNDTAINIIPSNDGGENIKFADCSIFQNGQVLQMENQNSNVYFIGTSFDYNYKGIFNVLRGKVFAQSCYFENVTNKFSSSNRPFYLGEYDGNNMQISNSHILFKTTLPITLDYIFVNDFIKNSYSGIQIHDCFLQGLKTATNRIALGRIDFKGSICYQWDRQSSISSDIENKLFDAPINNADLERHKEFYIVLDENENYTQTNGTNVDIYSGVEKWGTGSHAITLRKNTAKYTKGSIAVLIPCVNNDMFGYEFSLKANKEGTVHVRSGFANFDGKKLVDKTNYQETLNFPVNTDETKIKSNGTIKNNSSFASYFFVEFDLTDTNSSTEIYLKNLYITEF